MTRQKTTPSKRNDGLGGSPSNARLRIVKKSSSKSASSQSDDYSINLLRPLFEYVLKTFDQDTLADIIHESGLPSDTVTRKNFWIDHKQFENFLAAVRELVESDEEFKRACAEHLKSGWGPYTLLLRSISVAELAKLGARTMHRVCRVGHYEVHNVKRTSLRLRYISECSESRLACLSRQAAIARAPSLFLGALTMPLIEHSCASYGDDYCEYGIEWHQPLRFRWIVFGALLGMMVAYAFVSQNLAPSTFAFSTLAGLGGAMGALLEYRKVLAAHLRFEADTSAQIERIVLDHAIATDELRALQAREVDWNNYIEEGVANRTRQLNAIIERLRNIIQQRAVASETDPDSATTPSNSSGSQDGATSAHSSLRSPREPAVDQQVSRLVGELATVTNHDSRKRDLKPESISVDKLVVQIRQQLKAIMIGRDVRITVLQTREAPATITSIRPLLERIVDNLLLNASRHTDRGSIVVEASGTPGSLLLKFSDTGSGLSHERLEEVFDKETNRKDAITGSAITVPNDRSGLAYAARIIEQIGGRLEIMSEPGTGSTIWFYLPVVSPDETPDQASPTEQAAEVPHADNEGFVGRVVHLRAPPNT